MRLNPLKTILLTNTVIQFFSRFVSAGLTFLITTLIIRWGNLSLYGDYLKVVTLLFFNYTLIDLGLNASVVRQLSQLSSPRRQADLLSHLFSLRLLLSFLVTSLTLTWLFLTHPANYPLSVKLAYLAGIPTVFLLGFRLSLASFFQFQLNYFKTALTNLSGSFSFFLLSLLILLFFPSLFSLILAFTFGYLISALVAFWLTRHFFRFRFQFHPSLHLLLHSSWLSLTFIFSTLANKLDLLIASLYRPSAEIGQYGFAYKLFEFAILLPTLFMNVIYPLLLQAPTPRAKRRLTLKTLTLFFFLSLILAIFLFLLSPLILVLKPNLTLSLTIFRLLLCSLPFFYLTAPLMWYWVSLHRERFLVFTYALATLLNTSLNFSFVPRFGVIASALITLVTEAFIFLLLTFGLFYFRRPPASSSGVVQ